MGPVYLSKLDPCKVYSIYLNWVDFLYTVHDPLGFKESCILSTFKLLSFAEFRQVLQMVSRIVTSNLLRFHMRSLHLNIATITTCFIALFECTPLRTNST